MGRVMITLAILLLVAPLGTLAQEDPDAPRSGWGALPPGITFAAIANPTSADLAEVASLLRVSRMTWGPEADLFGVCFDLHSGGPVILYVESGTLRIVINESSGQSETMPEMGLPLLARGSSSLAATVPVIVLPNTRLELTSNDLLAMPNGTSCGMYGSAPEVVFLRIDGFPAGPGLQSHADLGMLVTPLDVSLGMPTAQEEAPSTIVAGELRLDPGMTLTLGDQAWPIFFRVRQGAGSLSIASEGGIVRPVEAGSMAPSEVLMPDEIVDINIGAGAYLPLGAPGTLTNVGDNALILLSAAVVPPAAPLATPTS